MTPKHKSGSHVPVFFSRRHSFPLKIFRIFGFPSMLGANPDPAVECQKRQPILNLQENLRIRNLIISPKFKFLIKEKPSYFLASFCTLRKISLQSLDLTNLGG